MTVSGSGGQSEETPLLTAKQHEEVYLRFKPAKKRGIVAIVSATGLLACTVSTPCYIKTSGLIHCTFQYSYQGHLYLLYHRLPET